MFTRFAANNIDVSGIGYQIDEFKNKMNLNNFKYNYSLLDKKCSPLKNPFKNSIFLFN